MDRFRLDNPDFSVESGTGVPSGWEWPVFEQYDELIASLPESLADVEAEWIVSVRPFAHLLAVHQHLRLAHRPIEKDGAADVFSIVNVNEGPVAAFAAVN